jgi:hypothetical protein
VSDDGTVTLARDGTLRDGLIVRTLASRVPATHVPGGYGLTPDGRFALIYGYRVDVEAGMERARDATLWVVSLAGSPDDPFETAPLVATLSLADAVGCTAALAAGETCRHHAHVAVVEGARSAFVLGQRGLAAVALPEAVMASVLRAPAAARNKPRAWQQRIPMNGILKVVPSTH